MRVKGDDYAQVACGETLCDLCGATLRVTLANGQLTEGVSHECRCLREQHPQSPRRSVRIAVGVCCGRSLGDALLREEDYHDGAPWAVGSDCTCPRLGPA